MKWTDLQGFRVGMVALFVVGSLARADFTAYNDFRLDVGTTSPWVTTNNPVEYPGPTPLIDYVGQTTLTATVSFSGAANVFGNTVGTPPNGSDAYNVFNGIVSPDGYTYINTGDVVMTFANLDPAKFYEFAYFGSRGGASYAYSNRETHVIISSVVSFTNASSVGVTKYTSVSSNDGAYHSAANLDGKIIQFVGVDPGSDGTIVFTLRGIGTDGASNNIGYANAFRLKEIDPAGGGGPGGYTAFNDPAWHQDAGLFSGQGVESAAGNYTTNSPWGLTSGPLMEDDGTPLSAQVTFSGSPVPPAAGLMLARTFSIPAGTDASTIFQNKIGTNNAITWEQGTLTMTLSALDSSKTYNLVIWSSRGGTSASYSNRWTDIVLKSVDGFTNSSSAGITRYTTTVSNDSARVVSVIDGGRVARYDGIQPGIDGTIVVDMTANGLVGTAETNGYLNAFMLQENTGPVTPIAPNIANATPTVLGPNSATLAGSLSSTGYSPTEVWVFYRAGADGGTNKTSWTNSYAFGYRTAGALSHTANGLASNTTYYYRYYASNAVGETWASSAQSFTTPAGVATVSVSLTVANRRQLYTSTQRAGLIVSEIMYNPALPYTNDYEFIELYNTESYPETLTGWRLSGDISYSFPSGQVIGARSYLVIAKNPALIQSIYGISGVLGPFSNSLPSSGSIRIRDNNNAVLFDGDYGAGGDYPLTPDGAGHSLVLGKPDYGEGDPRAWEASAACMGNPGTSNRALASSYTLQNVCINEIMAHTDPPEVDYIEVVNKGTGAVDISGCYLSDDVNNRTRFQIPGGTVLNARSSKTFAAAQLGFGLSMAGGRIYLMNPSSDVMLDAMEYEAQANGVAYGRWPDGGAWHELTAKTTNALNTTTSLRIREIVINEIMYHPIGDDSDFEYVEIFNRASTNINIGYWRFVDGIDYMIPPGTVLASSNYLVVAKDRTAFLARYTNVSASAVLGDYDGTLSDGGERIALSRPDDIAVPFQDFVIMDEVAYSDAWGRWADGGGSALELKDPRSDNRLAGNWADSDESGKAPWSTVEVTANLDDEDIAQNLNASLYCRQVSIFLAGAGEALVDELHVTVISTEYVQNPTLDGGTSSWVPGQGTHKNSTWEAGTGYSGACIHLRASGGGNPRVDSLGATLNDGINPGNTVKLSVRSRWLAGNPQLNAQLAGNGIWAAGVLNLPGNLGTPGARNSRHVTNAGPDIADLWYSPVLPRSGSNVVVTVSLRDVDGVQGADVRWRLDPATTYSITAMNDSGTGGDRISGDGTWSATLTGQAYTNVIGFYVQARDSHSSQTTNYLPALATPGTNEVYILFGMTNGAAENNSYGVFRYIMPPSMDRNTTAGAYWSWDRMDNMYMDCTLIYNDSRIIPNAGTRLGGSIWTRPKPGSTTFPWWDTGRMPNTFREMNQTFRFELPKKERLLGATFFQLDHMVNPSRGRQYYGVSDPTFSIEAAAGWMARSIGLYAPRIHYMHLFGNDYHKCNIMGDIMQPQDDFIETYFPDDAEGDTYEVKGWYETTKTLANNDNGGDGPSQYYFIKSWKHDDGTLRDEMYRLLWDKKPNGKTDTDASTIVNVADVVDRAIDGSAASQKAYLQRVDKVVDWEQWARSIAFRHAIVDWDTWGFFGRNKYMYIPKGGKAKLLEFDYDTGMGYEGQSDEAGAYWDGGWAKPIMQIKDLTLSNQFFQCYAIRRAYWRGIRDMINVMEPTGFNAQIDKVYYGHVSNNLTAYIGARPGFESVDTNVLAIGELAEAKNFTAVRRNFLLTNGQYYAALTTTAFSASGPGTTGSKTFQITGNAPIMAKTLKVNSNAIPDVDITWTSETAYSMDVSAVTNGSYNYAVTAWDRNGVQVGSVQNISVNYTGSFSSPSGQLVITEIMFDSATERGGFIELYNKHSTEPFDLAGLRLNGVDFTFPAGSVIGPLQYGVVAASESVFYRTYTNDPLVVLGEYPGSLDDGGERISLQKMQVNGAITNWITWDTVRYENERPWPNEVLGSGYSLQLIDPNQDNDRLANWSTARRWQYVAMTGTAGNATLYLYMENLGSAYLDDMKLVAGTLAGVGTNLLTNGNFEAGWPAGWLVGEQGRESGVVGGLAHSGNYSLTLRNLVAGANGTANVWQNIPVVGGQTYTLSFWYLPASTGSHFTVRTSGSWLSSTVNSSVTGAATPGSANSVAGTLSSFPLVYINEIMPNNSSGSGIQDNGGDYAPWLELYNTNGASVNLSGSSFYLTDDYDSFTKWAFTGSQTMANGARQIVWCDAETNEHSPSANPHTSFSLPSTNGTIALVQINNGRTTVVDYVNYTFIPTNKSQGLSPEGDPYSPQIFDLPTPGTGNNASSIVVTIYINEWMANNAAGGVMSDPADGDFDDWFELYNPNASPADLSGYTLGDTLAGSNAYVIPAGFTVPGLGRLLVWADNETVQNSTNGFLHVDFRLNNSGEYIGLFRPDGTMVDGVSFTNQKANISEGRYPDGALEVYEMAIPTPNAANRLFQVTSGTTGTGAVSLSWTALPGKEYQIWSSTNLRGTNWTVVTATNIPAGTATNLSFSIPAGSRRDYLRLIQK